MWPTRVRSAAARIDRRLLAPLLFRPADAAPLHAFRRLLGATLLLEAARLLRYDRARAWFTDTPFHFRWAGWAWVPLPPTTRAYQLHFLALGAAGAALACERAAPRLRRGAVTALLLLYAWFFLWDAGYYNNHYYLTVLLLAGFFATEVLDGGDDDHRTVNVHRRAGAAMRRPRWHLGVFRFQIIVVYFFGGLAKVNRDW